MFHWKNCLFLALVHCPLQLDSAELFMKRGNVFCLWHLTHRANIWSTKLQHVFWHQICVSVHSLIPPAADFFSPSKSHPAIWHRAWTPSQTFSMTMPAWISIYLCVFSVYIGCVRVPSQVRWSPVARTVIRPLYAICRAINRRLQGHSRSDGTIFHVHTNRLNTYWIAACSC